MCPHISAAEDVPLKIFEKILDLVTFFSQKPSLSGFSWLKRFRRLFRRGAASLLPERFLYPIA
jgi:hypothetical protein